jgi:hypothetical protein
VAYTSTALEGNAVELLLNGDEIFPAALTAIRSARETITYEQYFYEEGAIGRELAEALAERCRAGLRVHILLDGFGMGESPRWHEGRLWFANWGTNEIIAVDVEGNREVMGAGGGGSGWAVSWLRSRPSSVGSIDPAIKVIPLAQAWGQSQSQLIPYAKERGIPIPADVERSYRTDANLWGRSIQCGLLVDAWQDVPEDLFAMAKSADDAPDRY